MTGERVEPYSEEAERGVLGSALLESAKVIRAALVAGLVEDAFFVAAHRRIWAGILDLGQNKGGMVDTLLLGEWLKLRGWLDEVGGPAFLDKLIDDTPTAAHAEHYIEIVAQKRTLRRALATLRQAQVDAATTESGEALVQQTVTRLLETVMEKRNQETVEQKMERMCAKWEKAANHEEAAIGLEMPWDSLTDITCGLEIGMTILAARPSMGKTTLEDCIRVDVAGRQGKPVGCVTLDSTTDELLARAMCRTAGVSLPKLKFGYGHKDQIAKCREAAALLKTYPMVFDDHSRDIRQICSVARAWKLEKDIQLLTVDFVQLITAEELGRAQMDAVARVSYVSGKLKALAMELRIPVLVLSQLSRAIEKEGRTPQLSDLRDSGSLEQDAHKVMFIYRDVAKCKAMDDAAPKHDATKHKRACWIDVLKNKDGETGGKPFWMYPPYFRFEEADPEFTHAEVPEWDLQGGDQ